jgi:hypothetical protein
MHKINNVKYIKLSSVNSKNFEDYDRKKNFIEKEFVLNLFEKCAVTIGDAYSVSLGLGSCQLCNSLSTGTFSTQKKIDAVTRKRQSNKKQPSLEEYNSVCNTGTHL